MAHYQVRQPPRELSDHAYVFSAYRLPKPVIIELTGHERGGPLIDLTTVPIGERSLVFPTGMFQSTTTDGDAGWCERAAQAARIAAPRAANPLLCLAQAAWWAAAADRIATNREHDQRRRRQG